MDYYWNYRRCRPFGSFQDVVTGKKQTQYGKIINNRKSKKFDVRNLVNLRDFLSQTRIHQSSNGGRTSKRKLMAKLPKYNFAVTPIYYDTTDLIHLILRYTIIQIQVCCPFFQKRQKLKNLKIQYLELQPIQCSEIEIVCYFYEIE